MLNNRTRAHTRTHTHTHTHTRTHTHTHNTHTHTQHTLTHLDLGVAVLLKGIAHRLELLGELWSAELDEVKLFRELDVLENLALLLSPLLEEEANKLHHDITAR
jgi:hypothetical protein